MKKYLIAILVVLTMFVAQVGIVAAAPMAEGTVTLAGVQYVAGKGPVFTFNVNGKFSKADLKGSLHVENGADYTLHCTQVDEDTVTCNVSQKVSGVNAVVTWGGSTFWVYVPEAPTVSTPAQTEYCYSIWDYWEFTDGEWADFGPHCQDAPANEGDEITYTVPDPGGSFEAWVEFFSTPPGCAPSNGSAYYYNCSGNNAL